MTTNGGGQSYAPVLAALASMQGNVDRSEKAKAHAFLESFQKSAEAWQATHELLQSPETTVEAKLFAATTLKGKISFDLDQLPRDTLPSLRGSLFSILQLYLSGPRPIRTQLCVCVAALAIRMTEWDDVLSTVVGAFDTSNAAVASVILEILTVLPEELNEGRKINLPEDILEARTQQLLSNNVSKVLEILKNVSANLGPSDPQLMRCLTSWSTEIPAKDIVESQLLGQIMQALNIASSFEAAVECLCTLFKETRDVDSSMDVIKVLYPQIMSLQPKIAKAAADEDEEVYKGLTKIFSEAGENWVVLIVRMAGEFRPLVEAVLECAVRDTQHEAISLTFHFWYEMQSYLTYEKYMQARVELADIFSTLVDVMIKHLEYPIPEDGDDPFDGDKEAEEKFREFRHNMGDVLKDCCQIIGPAECLGKAFALIEKWRADHPGNSALTVPEWQKLEAPIFSLRAMGRVVPKDENIVLPRAMPVILQLPEHEKIRFAATLSLGRYTEWTAEHPELLEPQLNYIIAGFGNSSEEVLRAAAMALKHFCIDCKHLLGNHAAQLQNFYEQISTKLQPGSLEEATEGVASVVSVQPVDKIYEMLQLYCGPILQRLMAKANAAVDKDSKYAVADTIQLVCIFVDTVTPVVQPGQENPAVKYCAEILPILFTILDNFIDFAPIPEKICRCLRSMILSYRFSMAPLLPPLVQKLVECFERSRNGCFLWVSSAVVREFSDGAENVDQETSDYVYQFFERQTTTMLRLLNEISPTEQPDLLEDFFRLLADAVLYYPSKLLPSALFPSIFDAALAGLTLQSPDPLIAVLHYLRDILSYGGPSPSTSTFEQGSTPAQLQQAVLAIISQRGDMLIQRIIAGLLFSFPRDCIPDGSGVLFDIVEIAPQDVTKWIAQTITLLPTGSVSSAEVERLMNTISSAVAEQDWKKVRYTMQDFTNQYRRRNVAPREGLGRLEATKFRFAG